MCNEGPMASSGYRDYWQTLGVGRGADSDTIKRAFRKLARQYHPDVNPGDRAAEARFKEINEAYEVLGDPGKRQRYEQFGRYFNVGGMGGAGGSGARSEVDFGRYGNFDEFIKDLLGRSSGFASGFGSAVGTGFPGGMGVGPRAQAPNLDAEASISVPFADAFRGCERTLSVNQERVQVRIPAGVKAGSKLRLKGKGNLQPGTGRRGDLYLLIQVQPHPVWRLEGDILRGDLPLAIDEVALGGDVAVPTPDGSATVTIPAGIQAGRSLRLRGKGWPGRNGRGDLLLTVQVHPPQQLSSRERELLEALRAVRDDDPRAAMADQSLL